MWKYGLFLVCSFLLISLCASLITVNGQAAFTAFAGATIEDSKIDGVIGNEWNDAGTYPEASIFGNKTAALWLKHDGSYLYVAYRIVGDSNNPWSAMQFSDLNCMANGADAVLLGHDEYSPNGYVDISFGGMGIIYVDAVQNGKGVINVEAANITVELKKPLNSGDTGGKDIAWSTNRTYIFRIMWDSDGNGSSGGNTSHQTTGNPNVIALSVQAVPEIPSAVFFGFLIAILVCAFVFAKSKGYVENHATSQR
jgi:hypothetical protein